MCKQLRGIYNTCPSVGAISRGKPNRRDSATMDGCSPHISPHLVVQGLRPLESLDNALVRVQVLFNTNSPILDIEYRLIGLP